MRRLKAGGGFRAIFYSLKIGRRVGLWKLWSAMRSKNACKTCAVGMGGQLGGMVNEGGFFPEVCKKSFQAMASDMQAGIKPEFFKRFGLNELKALSPRDLEYCGRIVDPIYAGPGDTHYRVIGWEEALEKTIAALKAAGPQRSFFYASGRSSNEAGFLLQLFSRVFGTNYVNNCSYYCHQASGVGLASSIGVGTGTVQLEDVDKADLYVLIGGNPASNHPRLLRNLMTIRRRGGKIIVINPAKELGLTQFRVPSDVRSLLFGSQIASQYLQPHIGGDIALLTGMAKAVLAQSAEDKTFIAQKTEGYDAFIAQVKAMSWDEIVRASGVPQSEIESAAETYCKAKNVIFGWTMGITHHLHGVQNVQAIANLALMRGMVGRAPAGLMPIRGHSNVQGIGSVGVTPILKAALLKRFEEELKIEVPKSPGLDTMACVEAAYRGEMDAALCLGGNLYGSNPDANYAAKAMRNLKHVTYLSTTLNTGHAWGLGKETLVLPVLPRDEEPEPTTQESMFSFVRYSEGGKARYPGPRSEVSILATLGERILGSEGPVDWKSLQSHQKIRELIARLVPEYEQVGKIDITKKEFSIPGRALHNGTFPTSSGKAKFHVVPLPTKAALAEDELMLMTVRSEGQFNSVVYEEEDLYRNQERRDIVMLNEQDMQRLGLKPDQRVRLKSVTGEMRYLLARPFDVRAGNAIAYYPESNVLIPRDVDPQSKTPAFKAIRVTIAAE
jgi:molybdopterin-dependent oxidoreductase alpha subunit